MVLTALLLCVQKTKNHQRWTLKLYKTVVLALVIITPSLLTGCGSGGDAEYGPIIPIGTGSGGGASPAFGGASVSLAWDLHPDSSVIGYFVYYGTQPSNSPGSCAYARSSFSSSPSATITGLAPNTTYYFAVSAYNGHQSACSSEVSTVTSGGSGTSG
jgi:hypothetical protein